LHNVETPSPNVQDISRRLRQIDRRDQIIDIARRLVAVPSPNPPLATGPVAETAEAILKELVPDIEVELHRASSEVVNLVARVRGRAAGRRLVFNGHLDTYPIGNDLGWTVDPLGGELQDGRLYGRGVCDMKGGIASSIFALALLAECRDAWSGELVLTLGGDEESMGTLGTQFLIDRVAHARGDAVIIGDAGSPRVIRFGEKGFLWITIEAEGVAAHGAHVHRGVNAIDRLRAAMDAVSSLRQFPVRAPDLVRRAVLEAQPISEILSGEGEARVLTCVTVNFGRIEGGVSPNLVPSSARVAADIRIPVGVLTGDLEGVLTKTLEEIKGIKLTIDRQVEPTYTDPAAEIVRHIVRAATDVLGSAPAVNMRVGASDARIFRKAGIPAVVYGPTPFNMGGPDEHVLVDELVSVMRVHAIAALCFLAAPEPCPNDGP
jgi:succinyl-diaminopimelate desuccinylase